MSKGEPLWKKVIIDKYGIEEGRWCSLEVRGGLWCSIVEGYKERMGCFQK